ncbi:MAG: hypothetical protein UY92_C0010G0026 [Candidatus Magasanikbacteria bacterium GW2011_GWA2_56_11]|uniref:Uncharacterized protein n=1 Tax=Candidatus Magasanikbacteria bacterium GW2011_GWA2_56_11 TaxID=1619044 RepID=A0A0G1YG14_9BACT|nr:MAG: hypothetical protein UY92_C0010G0026 [Candidatus Magasanikbacteria bacterium GW2011_GWA2_56_11]
MAAEPKKWRPAQFSSNTAPRVTARANDSLISFLRHYPMTASPKGPPRTLPGDDGIGVIIGLIILLSLLVVLIVYGIPALRRARNDKDAALQSEYLDNA